VFCSLLNSGSDAGFFDIELLDFAAAEQAYVENTAVAAHPPYDTRGGSIEITDFAPRFEPLRPHVPADHAGAPPAPQRKAARACACACARSATTAAPDRPPPGAATTCAT
jgi:hypothetical protein